MEKRFGDEMQIDKTTGLLESATYIPSPNCDDRPLNTPINLLVIHNISLPPGDFGGEHISQLFTNCLNPNEHDYFKDICHLRVSSHLLIRRDGQLIQYVPFHKRAWHAGVSSYDGQTSCNDFSIGIELEGTDTITYEKRQYDKLIDVSKVLLATYQDLEVERITGHENIAPGRKTDPGPAFDWNRYFNSLNDL